MNQLLVQVEQVQFLQPQEPPQEQLPLVLLGYQHSQVLHLVCTRLFQGHVHALMM
jgi:hypothetical protein